MQDTGEFEAYSVVPRKEKPNCFQCSFINLLFSFVCKDINSDRPMMQVGPYVFAGEYEDALGTCVLFEETPGKGKLVGGLDLKYLCHTAKKLKMQRIFLTEKKEGEASAGSCDGGKQMDTTCESSQGENVNLRDKTEKDGDNADLDNSAVG
uniref:General transcription factor 3C polypeptide 6-like n=1 Tax=Neolamprologus brichardi TaxID=32507 RepID=A0A3Q4HZL7_NEOBR